MTDIQATPATTQAGAHWRVVARSATLAQHYWITALRATRPCGPAAMSEIALAARITEVIAVTGPGLSRDLHSAGRGDQAAKLLAATTSGLRSAAVAARQTAAAQAAPSLADLIQPVPRLVLVVRRRFNTGVRPS